jgi:queuine tRNA-ribosyltransferase
LTDSGGYQVYSLSANRKIKEEGVSLNRILMVLTTFTECDGIQRSGADIIMAFDECTRILVITVTLKNHENDTSLVK